MPSALPQPGPRCAASYPEDQQLTFDDLPPMLTLAVALGTVSLREALEQLLEDGMLTQSQAQHLLDSGMPSSSSNPVMDQLMKRQASTAAAAAREEAPRSKESENPRESRTAPELLAQQVALLAIQPDMATGSSSSGGPAGGAAAEDDVDGTLRRSLAAFFSRGERVAAVRYSILEKHLKMKFFQQGGCSRPDVEVLRADFKSTSSNKAAVAEISSSYPWQGCKLAATLMGLLCVDMGDEAALQQVVRWLARSLGGLPSLATTRTTPSSSLQASLAAARDAVAAPGAGCTCLLVNLVDLVILKAVERGDPSVARFGSYAHSCALLVSRGGVSVFQAWGKYGYTLQEWAARHPAPMGWERAEAWARAYDEFCGMTAWDERTNEAYRQLFEVDVRAAYKRQGLAVPGRIKSWTRVLVLPGVTSERVLANLQLLEL